MADNRGAWGIEVGQAGLKAIRLRYAEAADQVIAVAFDYIPHPKILSQPDAIPEQIIPQAIEKFLSRNDVQGDKIAISVPGQTALARFIQLPPVDSTKVAEIVKYEARQQIPFALEDVIWDYQNLGGIEESGFLLEAEIGLFAMKREQVIEQLQPFVNAKIEVDLIQIAPLALYNVLSYDQFGHRVGHDEEPSNEHTIMIDMGADNSTLLVSNGQKIWIRNVPIGGNHFTRALTKEMKLTFAKAEHLKCNATKAPDPRAVFQALRPVFNDYVSEIQRSVGYFSSVNRDAVIKKVIGVGNGFRLAGLQKFLQQNLQYEVVRLDNFQSLVGDSVVGASLFKKNILSFTVPYGLALQALDLTQMHTTLLPPEIALARNIRRKKPWAVVTAASLLFGLATSVAASSFAWQSVSPDRWGLAMEDVDRVTEEIISGKRDYDAAGLESEELKIKEDRLVENARYRDNWALLNKVVAECLPRDTGDALDEEDPTKQNRIKVTSFTSQKVDDLGEWYRGLKASDDDAFMSEEDKDRKPSGEGYVIRLEGMHYHHDSIPGSPAGRGIPYLRANFLQKLQQWTCQNQGSGLVPVRLAGITHATIVHAPPSRLVRFSPDGDKVGDGSRVRLKLGPDGGGPGAGPGEGADPENSNGPGQRPNFIDIPQTQFIIEFAWQPTSPRERVLFTRLTGIFKQQKKKKGAPDPTFDAVTEVLNASQATAGLKLEQKEFDDYVKRFHAGEDKSTDGSGSNN